MTTKDVIAQAEKEELIRFVKKYSYEEFGKRYLGVEDKKPVRYEGFILDLERLFSTYTKDLLQAKDEELSLREQELWEKIQKILVDEINIAHSECHSTSRLTSAYNRIQSLLGSKEK